MQAELLMPVKHYNRGHFQVSRNGRRHCELSFVRTIGHSVQRCDFFKTRATGNSSRSLACALHASLPAQRLTAVISRARDLKELTGLCTTYWDALNHIHVSAALSTAVKLPGAERKAAAAPLLSSLAARFAHILPNANIREVATVLWALAKLGQPAPCLLLDEVLAAQLQRDLLRSASPQALANILWALATWGTRGPDPLLHLLLERCCQVLPAFQPQDTANVLWALARLDTRGGQLRPRLPPQLLPGLLTTATAQAGAMTPQGLATSVWACQRLRQQQQQHLVQQASDSASVLRFLRAAAVAFLTVLPAASPIDVALLTASLARLRFRCPALLRAVAERCCSEIPSSNRRKSTAYKHVESAAGGPWSPLCRQRLLWAFATLEVRHPAAVRALLLGLPMEEQRGDDADGGGDGAAAAVVDVLGWSWEPGDWADQGDNNDLNGHGGSADGSAAALGASSLIWCMARLGCGRVPGPEQRAVLAAADRLWASREAAALGHAAVAAWGLQHLGLAQERLLRLAATRLLQVLESRQQRPLAATGSRQRAASADTTPTAPDGGAVGGEGDGGAVGGEGDGGAVVESAAKEGAAAHRSESCRAAHPRVIPPGDLNRGDLDSKDLDPGDLDAAVMVLWCLGRRGPLGAAASAAWAADAEAGNAAAADHDASPDSGDGDAAAAAAAAESRLLGAFSQAAPGLLPRLSVRQLPLVCCSYVQLGRTDAAVLGGAAELLMRRRWPSGGGAEVGRQPQVESRVASSPDQWAVGRDGDSSQHPARAGSRSSAAGAGGLEAEEGEEEDWQLEGGDWTEIVEEEVESGQGDVLGGGGGGDGGGGSGSGGGGLSDNGGGTGRRRSCSRAGGGGSLLLNRLPRNGLAMTLWALASAGYASPQLMQCAAAAVMKLFPPLPPVSAAAVAAAAPSPRAVATDAAVPAAAVTEASWNGAGADNDKGKDEVDPRGGSCRDAEGAVVDGAGEAPGPQPPGAAASRWAALILWAFAAADCYNAVLYDNLLSYMLRKVSRLGPGRVALVLWSCAVAGHYRRDVLEALGGALREDMRGLPPASFTQANWAIAHLSAGLCLSWRGPAAAHLAALAPRLTSRQAAVLLWTLAVQQLVMARQDSRKFAAVVDLLLEQLEAAAGAEAADRDPGDGEWAAAGGDPGGAHGDAATRGSGLERAAHTGANQDLDTDSSPTCGLLAAAPPAPPPPPLEPGVALIAAEALALLLANPKAAVRARVQAHLNSPPPVNANGGAAAAVIRGSVMRQLAASWQHALRRRHPLQAAVAAAARQLGYCPRLLRTHGAFPLALPSAVELPDAAPGPAVLLLAEASDFATNVVGQPLGPLFTTVQLLRERGWRVAVVVGPRFASLRPPARQLRHLRHLLQAAGVSAREPPPPAGPGDQEGWMQSWQ